MPPKRAAGSSSKDSVATSKKFRSAIDKGVDEFLCPITQARAALSTRAVVAPPSTPTPPSRPPQELPVDPVTAKDGRVV